MKKQPKKLVLAKETVRKLGEVELAAVAGALTTSCPSIDVICKYPPSRTC